MSTACIQPPSNNLNEIGLEKFRSLSRDHNKNTSYFSPENASNDSFLVFISTVKPSILLVDSGWYPEPMVLIVMLSNSIILTWVIPNSSVLWKVLHWIAIPKTSVQLSKQQPCNLYSPVRYQSNPDKKKNSKWKEKKGFFWLSCGTRSIVLFIAFWLPVGKKR